VLPEHDNQVFSYSLLQVDATRAGGTGVMSLAGEGWIGTDFDRLWWNVDGDLVGGSVSDLQLRAMYGRYFARFWDAVVGYRRDVRPVGVNYLGAGIRGLAPYWFDVDAMLFVSDRAKLSLQTEVSTDLLLTQRLILRPELRLDWPLMRDPVRGLDPGLGDADIGIATRYEIRRKLAPYVDVRWSRRAGVAGPLEQSEGHDVTGWTVRGGLWLIF
jgi:copper resistance protein B